MNERGRWLLTERASRLFFVSSAVVLTTGILLVVLSELSRFGVIQEFSSNPAFYLPLIVILTANAFCALLLLVGMPWYWARFDDSRWLVKLFWLGSFVLLGWYSMSIYYFFVYRRQRPSAILPAGVNE